MKILELRDVSYSYSKGTPFEKKALDSVSVGFESGRVTGIIGHTGSGKSTLVNLLNGLYRPDAGEVILDGKNIWDEPKKISSVRFRVGLVMQYPEYQLFDETVRSDIAYAPRNLKLDKEEIERRVRAAADFAGLDDVLLDRSPFELSGGQKRRAAIAGVLAMEPDVLVLDEPAAGLDPRGRREILGGICKRYAKERGISVILVSHSMEDMASYCDDVVVMNNGKIHRCGEVSEIFKEAEELESIGLDVPQISKIASKLAAEGITLTGETYTVDGFVAAFRKYAEGVMR